MKKQISHLDGSDLPLVDLKRGLVTANEEAQGRNQAIGEGGAGL